ncbi:MAG: hypothetical protein A07HR60_01812 [uncultured archaeon A07HR60]|nr:MAG: hypothetical protein A07HR60_01812 [uncultured archaeon A07HR60]
MSITGVWDGRPVGYSILLPGRNGPGNLSPGHRRIRTHGLQSFHSLQYRHGSDRFLTVEHFLDSVIWVQTLYVVMTDDLAIMVSAELVDIEVSD